MDFKLSGDDLLQIRCSLLVVGGFEREAIRGAVKRIDDALGGVLSRTCEEERFNGEMGKSIMINTLGKIGAQRVLLLGLGKKSKFSQDVLRKVGMVAAKRARTFSDTVAFGILINRKKGSASAIVEGVMLGSYEFSKYKANGKKDQGIKSVQLLSTKIREREFREEAEFARIISDSTNLARDLVNEPPVNMTPTKLAEVAREIAKAEKLECRIFDRDEMEKKGMGGLLAVSRGSEEAPKFIHLCYEPKGSAKKTVAVVGKGITFDSGGLCIKPRDNMRTMKGDMSGAACVLGVMKAVPKLNPSIRIHGLISATENMPGARAYKPDDIIRALNGKTIEVIDTDAEGRIVLSDALSYAVELKVDEIVDLATLTGSCIVALGEYTAGVMGNNERLINRIIQAAKIAGEKVWQLPMDDELRKEIESDVADVKNVGSRWGGAITAAMFLEKFVGSTPWVHLDIAGPAFLEKGGDWYPKGGTGFGVRTIVKYLLQK